MLTKKEYIILIDKMEEYSKEFSVGTPIISDTEYDTLYLKLREYEDSNFDDILPNSVTQSSVGDGEHKHNIQMLSIANVYNNEELEVWCEKTGSNSFIATRKLDGVSVEVKYYNGLFDDAILKGDTITGKSIVPLLKNNITLFAPKIKCKDAISFRGELIMKTATFNKLKKEHNLTHPNPCSLVSSIFSKKEQSKFLKFVDFIPFDVTKVIDYNDKMYFIKDMLGISVPYFACSKHDIANMVKSFDRDYGYPTDGIVVRVDDIKLVEELGVTKKHSKDAIALKPKPLSKTSKVTDIIYNNGSDGMLRPKVIIEPIELKNKTIKSINGYNTRYLVNNNICIGAEVIVILRGEVIPKIILSSTDGNAVILPTTCGSCETKLTNIDGNLYCKNNECKATNLQKALKHFRKGYKNIGEKSIESLFKIDSINSIKDIETMMSLVKKHNDLSKYNIPNTLIGVLERIKKC